MISAFGVEHGGEVSKLDDRQKKQAAAGAVGVGGAAAASQVRVPEHSHYNKKTRAYLHSLPAGVHEVDTKMLGHRPRKLGARKQQTPYVAAMAKERPTPYSPVPITRYKGDKGVIQRDNAHSVMANAMKGRKTTIKIEDAPGHRPVRPAGEEGIRRLQSRYQQRRLRQNTNLSEKKINQHVKAYKPSSRKANTTKRPHGQVEEGFKMSRHKYGAKVALGLVRKDRQRSRDTAAGAAGVAGGGVLATTPVRRSGAKVRIHETKSGPRIRSAEAKKIVSPGYRPGNRRAIQGMAHKLPKNAQGPTKVIRYKGGQVIPWDGNHRATARIARGDKSIPVKVIEGGERPAVSVTRNAIHVGQQKVHQRRMERGDFTSLGKPNKPGKAYHAIANASPTRSGRKELTTVKAAAGPTKAALRTKQGATVTAGAALLGTAHHLHRKKD